MRDGAPVSVMMFDLDRFKTINDTHGHAVGDAVIRKFCEATATTLRPTDLFGRIGGEEFAVVVAGLSIEAALLRAERIRWLSPRVANGLAAVQSSGAALPFRRGHTPASPRRSTRPRRGPAPR